MLCANECIKILHCSTNIMTNIIIVYSSIFQITITMQPPQSLPIITQPPQSFKIVKIVEGKGNKMLTAIPAVWEKDGTMYWPKITQAKVNKLMKNHTPPNNGGTDGIVWSSTKAKVLEDGFATLNAAEKRLNVLLRETDSSSACENDDVIVSGKRSRKTIRSPSSTLKNYSDMLITSSGVSHI